MAFASLMGPNVQDPRVYALCNGQVTVDNPRQLLAFVPKRNGGPARPVI